MYKIGDRVVYGMHGVCAVAAEEVKMVEQRSVCYLVLEPLGQPGSRFLVPTHNAAAMAKVKRMLTKAELEALICSDEVRQTAWIADEGQRKQCYRELISSGDRQRLLAMVRTLYLHRQEQSRLGRKVHLCDDNFLRDAEKLLVGEIAMVLDLEAEEARRYIRAQLSK